MNTHTAARKGRVVRYGYFGCPLLVVVAIALVVIVRLQAWPPQQVPGRFQEAKLIEMALSRRYSASAGVSLRPDFGYLSIRVFSELSFQRMSDEEARSAARGIAVMTLNALADKDRYRSFEVMLAPGKPSDQDWWPVSHQLHRVYNFEVWQLDPGGYLRNSNPQGRWRVA